MANVKPASSVHAEESYASPEQATIVAQVNLTLCKFRYSFMAKVKPSFLGSSRDS